MDGWRHSEWVTVSSPIQVQVAPGAPRPTRITFTPTALDAWLFVAGATDSPVFRRFWRLPPLRVQRGADRYLMGTNPIHTASVALVVRKCTRRRLFDARTPQD
jgi:hypothetical protein